MKRTFDPIAGPFAHAILLTDVDGDGIQDLAVRGESLQIFRGEAPQVTVVDLAEK